MIAGRVVGSLWATLKEESLRGFTFLVIQPLDARGEAKGDAIVAVDTLGAGRGQLVLVTTGSQAQHALSKAKLPIDAVVVSIIDKIDVDAALLE